MRRSISTQYKHWEHHITVQTLQTNHIQTISYIYTNNATQTTYQYKPYKQTHKMKNNKSNKPYNQTTYNNIQA